MRPQTETPVELLTPKEAASFLKCSRSSIYEWVRQGRLRCLRVGARLRFRREDLLAFALAGGGGGN